MVCASTIQSCDDKYNLACKLNQDRRIRYMGTVERDGYTMETGMNTRE